MRGISRIDSHAVSMIERADPLGFHPVDGIPHRLGVRQVDTEPRCRDLGKTIPDLGKPAVCRSGTGDKRRLVGGSADEHLSQRRLAGEQGGLDLARGPARLVTALGLGRDANGTSAGDGSGPVLLTPPSPPVAPALIAAGPRVGVTAAHDVPWRFWLEGEPSVSPYRRHTPRRRPDALTGGVRPPLAL